MSVDISKELNDFETASKGSEVRASFVSAFRKFLTVINKTDGNLYLKGSNVANISAENAEAVCGNDIGNIPVNTIYIVNKSHGIPNLPTTGGGLIITLSKVDRVYSGATQIYYSFAGVIYFRCYLDSKWHEWTNVGEMDTTLSKAGFAADAKATGDELTNLKESLSLLDSRLSESINDLSFIDQNSVHNFINIEDKIEDDCYWDISSGKAIKTHLEGWNSAQIEVKPNERYNVWIYPASGIKNKAIVAVDENFNVVKYLCELTSTNPVRFVHVPVTIPEGCKYMLLSSSEALKPIEKKSSFKFIGDMRDLGISNITDCDAGWYVCYPDYIQNIENLPSIGKVGFWLFVHNIEEYETERGKLYILRTSSGVEYITANPSNGWNASSFYLGTFGTIGIDDLDKAIQNGMYHIGGSVVPNLKNKPENLHNACILQNVSWNSGGHMQTLIEYRTNRTFTRWIVDGISTEWECNEIKQIESPLKGMTVSIIGDSISTNGNDGENRNVPEITITQADVGKTLSAFLTYYDVQNGLALGGYTYTSREIGTEVTFVPTSDDIGKSIGIPNNYNPNSTMVWWEVAMEKLEFKANPVCWSGSSITSHEGDVETRKTSYAWHEAQIRKVGIRKEGTMERTDPDVIIIYRGTNDMTHEPYTRLTEGYFDSVDFAYPNNDYVSGGYGYKEGLVLTISKLRARYPNAKIFLCTLNVFKRINYSHFPTNNGLNTLPQYNNAIREVADYMGCGLIEFDKDGITFENCYSEGYITDSATIPTHPSDKGHKVMGLKAIADLKAQFSKMG